MKKSEDKKNFIDIANSVGELVQEKNIAYGDSFAKSQEIVKILYPNGVQPEQYMDMLAITRVIDKLFRIATKKDAFGESPWRDICGYAVLGIANDEVGAVEKKETTPPYIDLNGEEIDKLEQATLNKISRMVDNKTNEELWEEQQEEQEEPVTYRELLRNPDRHMTDEEQEGIKESVKESVLFKACSEEEQERITESVAESIRIAQDTKNDKPKEGHGNPYANIDENDDLEPMLLLDMFPSLNDILNHLERASAEGNKEKEAQVLQSFDNWNEAVIKASRSTKRKKHE